MSSQRHRSRSQPRWYASLYMQVLLSVLVGVALGALAPSWGIALKPLGDGFIKLVKMIIAPVIFCTVVGGIAGLREPGKLGRVGLKALGYFLVVSSLALLLGLLVANVLRPGDGFAAGTSLPNSSPSASSAGSISAPPPAHARSVGEFVLQIIPDTALGAFTSGEILQVLLWSVLFGLAAVWADERARPALRGIESLGTIVFGVVRLVMKFAPLGALGAMAYTVGQFGIQALAPLSKLLLGFYLTSALFVLIVLGAIARWNGFSLLQLLRYLRSELLIVLGTASSEAALPPLIDKLERAGCSRSVAGLVVPAGYSFNLDGTNIYMTLAALFIAQATHVHLTWREQALLLAVAVISSKGAAGVSGSGFVTLAATLSVVPQVPVGGMALILGIDRFMSECRALTNFIGNAVGTLVVAGWEGELDRTRLREALRGNDAARSSS